MTSVNSNQTLLVKARVINYLIYLASVELSSIITLTQQYYYPDPAVDYITHFSNRGAVLLDIEYIKNILYPPLITPQDPYFLLASELFSE